MSSIHPSDPARATIATLRENAIATSADQTKFVRGIARALSEAMAKIHGGEWIEHISHEANAEFVMVRPLLRKGRASA